MKLAVLVLIAASGSLQPQEISHTTPPRVIHKADPEYTNEALDAKIEGLRQWRFSPATSHGEPIVQKATFEMNFRPPRSSDSK
jgi:hypothetical protein